MYKSYSLKSDTPMLIVLKKTLFTNKPTNDIRNDMDLENEYLCCLVGLT